MSTQFYRPFPPERVRELSEDEPYLECIYNSDWTEGHNHMLHCHAEVSEVLLILQGHGLYAVGLHRYSVQAGDVILCGSGVPHDEFPEADTPYRTLCFAFRRLALPGLAQGQFVAEMRSPVFHAPPEFEELTALGRLLAHHAQAGHPRDSAVCLHLTRALFEVVCQMVERRQAEHLPEQDALIARIERYIDAHYTEDITIDRLSRLFYISPFYLSHLFKQRTGYTLKQYILRRRVGEAQTRLFTTNDSVQQIAADMGFEDAAYFSRLFTKYVGMPPVEFRKWMNSPV